MRINHNLLAMNTDRQMGITNGQSAKSMEKLSSGLRINRAGDDAAGLSISEKMRAQIKGLDQASRNAQDGISMLQTAEGALNETHSILQRMRELAVQASSDTNVNVDRGSIQDEITQLKSEIDRIAETTEFNTQKLLKGDGSAAKEIGALKLANTGVVEQKTLSGGNIQAAAGAQMQLSLDTGKGASDLADKTFEFEFNGQSIKLDIKTVATAETAGANSVVTSEGGKAVTLTLVAGSLDQDFIMGKIKEALTTAMDENVDIKTEDYNISLDKSTLTIQSKATGTGESIAVSGSVGQDALKANLNAPVTHTGTALVGTDLDLDAATNKFDIVLNGGAAQTVTLTNTGTATNGIVPPVAGHYNMETADGRKALEENLQKDIDAVAALKGNVKVSVGDDGKISISTVSSNPDNTLALAAGTPDGLASLGLIAGTNKATNLVATKQTAVGTAEVREKATTTIDNFTLANLKDQILESGIAADNTDYFNAGDVSKDGAIKFLAGKGLTVGDETIEFYDSRKGKYEGTADFAVDLSLAGVSGTAALTATAAGDVSKILEQIDKQVGEKLKMVTLEATNNTLKVTAREAGIDANSLEVKDGVNRAATDIVGSKFNAEFQIGANEGQTMEVNITDMRADALGIKNIDLSTKPGAKAAITTLQKAIEKVSAQRSSLGAVQNRLEHSINNLDTSAENLQSAESRIRDVDMAKEMMNYQKNNILQQAAQAMLAQANQAPQGVLQLLR